mgnify:CR=1 FL=1
MSKKKRISNRSIVVLLAIALLISVSGTIFNVYVLNNGVFDILTGAATDTGTGTATITITGNTALSNQVTAIAFGSGFVNGSCTECVMDSDGFHNQTGSCCRDFTNVSSGFLLENTGNDNISVNYSCSGSCTSASFIGGTAPRFEIRVSANSVEGQTGESGSADTQTSCNSTISGSGGGGWNLTNISDVYSERTYALVETTAWLCGNVTNYPLESTDGYDAAVIDINISIPSDAPGGTGEQTATFTFTGQSTG